ncbi:hypothetical protein [Pseudovibrio sp. Tun.PSC04-5.I4]|uniref:hypothetical protein n=1 Tax=Pseudovibrio sp. Tun.PSC04-5.I4 TaxID=1798213 RepID=UPI00088EF354|nr:hypothetical protein [Pseudovibrio sp. Tun.PSC04-5.I4]SDQ18509.1 hypothetical protein SAMN04515695_0379 [Pseudovibrio sp. Tun.PSC04-5.I4]
MIKHSEHTHFDALELTRNLPADLISQIPVLMVNRQGNTDRSFMRTENFLGYAEPGKTYRLSFNGMMRTDFHDNFVLSAAAEPDHLELKGEWNEKIDLIRDEANILGGNGKYTLPEGADALRVPVAEATPEHLAYYDSRLVRVGDLLSFNSTGNLPVTVTSVGPDYSSGYLLDESKGGGAYLEVHDRPHFHMPLDEEAGGHLILGKKGPDGINRITAFKVPFGYGILMSPWAIHSDAYLVGRYMVIYSATPKFSTVIIRNIDGSLAPIIIEA